MCVTGPKNMQYGALAILLMIATGTSGVGFFAHQEIFVQEEPSVALSLLFTLATFLGLWTMLAHVCVMCSDPGILTHHGPKYSEQYQAECLDLEDEERAMFATDPIYQQSNYYQFRHCETC